MAKFGNRIVHMYYKIDDEFIYEIVHNNLEDFQRFITNIVKVIKH